MTDRPNAALRRTVSLVNRASTWVLMALIRIYQAVISPWVTQQCKYYPSCSAYGLEAVRMHGAVRGVRLTVWRILRCNPWSDGGVDHVPPSRAPAQAEPTPITEAPAPSASPTPDLARI